MVYSDALSATAPADTDLASLGDDAIRTHVRAIRERLASVFQDVDTDPLVLKPGVVGFAQLDAALGYKKVLFGSISLSIAAATKFTSGTTGVAGVAPGDIVVANASGLPTLGYIIGGYVAGADNVSIYIVYGGAAADGPGGSDTVSFAVIKQ